MGAATTINMGANGALFLFDGDPLDSHNGNVLTATGPMDFQEYKGREYLLLDGVNSLVAPNDATLDALGDLTISWTMGLLGAPVITGTSGLFFYGDTASTSATLNCHYGAYGFSTAYSFIYEYNSGTDRIATLSAIPRSGLGQTLNVWHVTRSATHTLTYLNGMLVDTYVNAQMPTGGSADALTIGALFGGGSPHGPALFGDFKINPGTALTAAQVRAEVAQINGWT